MSHALLIGTIILGLVLLGIVIYGIYAVSKYETGRNDSDDLVTITKFYWSKFDSWKDSVLAFMGVLILLLVYMAFQLTILNFEGLKAK